MSSVWDRRPMFALDADVTVYWPEVRPCWESESGPVRYDGVMTELARCQWAPIDHDADAHYLLDLERPCGHDGRTVPTCAEHTEQRRAQRVAERSTVCPVCGRTNAVAVVEVRKLLGAPPLGG